MTGFCQRLGFPAIHKRRLQSGRQLAHSAQRLEILGFLERLAGSRGDGLPDLALPTGRPIAGTLSHRPSLGNARIAGIAWQSRQILHPKETGFIMVCDIQGSVEIGGQRCCHDPMKLLPECLSPTHGLRGRSVHGEIP